MVDEQEKTEPTPQEKQPEAEQPEAEQPEADAAPVLKNLIILPPLQKSNSLGRDETLDGVPLPPIRAEEPVSSIRAALSEVVGYAHLTNYRFVLEEPPKSKPSGNLEPPAISPYTGRDAVVSVPVAVKSLETEPQGLEKDQSLVLDDYGDLTSLADSGLQDGSAFRVVLERYDVALIRDHVTRLRSLLDGNAPSSISLDEGAEAREKTASSEGTETPAEDETKPADSIADAGSSNEQDKDTPSGNSKEDANAKEKEQKQAAEPKTGPKNMPFYPTHKKVAADNRNLKDFFYLACGEDSALYSENADNFNSSKNENGSKSKKKAKKGRDQSQKDDDEKENLTTEQVMRETIPRLNELEEKTRVKCAIRFSGFHPPPQFRRLMGDLAYLDVTPPGETEAIHITAIPTGFYVNRSTSKNGNYKFGPSPSAHPCFSHELLDCLLQCSESFLAAWKEALLASKQRAGLMATLNEDGPFSSLFRVAIRGDFAGYQRPSTASASEGIDALIQNPSWLVPIPGVEAQSEDDSWTRNCVHVFNPSRTEDDLSNSFGVDIRSGTVRDWNEELQSAREMPVIALQERIERAR
jgi:protein TIF31